MKTYCVCYTITTSSETTVRANNKKDAIQKVKEILGDDTVIDGAWETKKKTNAYVVALP